MAVGSLPSIVPFMITSDTLIGLTWASVLAAVGLFAVGVAKARVTRGSSVKSGGENLVIAGLGGVVAYVVGALVGTGVG